MSNELTLQQQMTTLQTAVYSEEYYVDLYEYNLAKHEMSYAGVNRSLYSDAKIVDFANDFWLALPDIPSIRRAPFWLLCDIAEHCFDDYVDEEY